MIKKIKSLTQRAAEAVKSNKSSAELMEIRRELSERIAQVEPALKAKRIEIETAMGSGDLDELRAVRQAEADLVDEDKMLHRQTSELHQAIARAKGEEAMKAADQHSKNLNKALEQANKAQAMLADCQRIASEVVTARNDAEKIGEKLVFDSGTIRALAEAVHPQGNERKQMMINLGIRSGTVSL